MLSVSNLLTPTSNHLHDKQPKVLGSEKFNIQAVPSISFRFLSVTHIEGTLSISQFWAPDIMDNFSRERGGFLFGVGLPW